MTTTAADAATIAADRTAHRVALTRICVHASANAVEPTAHRDEPTPRRGDAIVSRAESTATIADPTSNGGARTSNSGARTSNGCARTHNGGARPLLIAGRTLIRPLLRLSVAVGACAEVANGTWNWEKQWRGADLLPAPATILEESLEGTGLRYPRHPPPPHAPGRHTAAGSAPRGHERALPIGRPFAHFHLLQLRFGPATRVLLTSHRQHAAHVPRHRRVHRLPLSTQ